MVRAVLLGLLLTLPVLAQEPAQPPGDPRARDREDLLAAQRAFDAGRHAQAIALLEGVHGRAGGDGGSHALLAHCYYAAGRTEDARRELVEALGLGHVTADVVLRLAEIARARGERLVTLQGLRVAQLLVPDDRAVLVALADAAAEAGLGDEAECAYRDALALDPSSRDTLLRLGNLHARRDEPMEALVAFRSVRALGGPDVTSQIAELYLARGDVARAAATYARMLDEGAGDTGTRLRCAELMFAAGDGGRAQLLAAEVAAGADAGLAARAHLLLGRVRAAAGDLDEAVRLWETALASGAGGRELHALLGMHYHRKGEHAAAVEHLRACLEGGPFDLERQTALVRSLVAVGDRDGARAALVARIEEIGLDEQADRLVSILAGMPSR